MSEIKQLKSVFYASKEDKIEIVKALFKPSERDILRFDIATYLDRVIISIYSTLNGKKLAKINFFDNSNINAEFYVHIDQSPFITNTKVGEVKFYNSTVEEYIEPVLWDLGYYAGTVADHRPSNSYCLINHNNEVVESFSHNDPDGW